MCTLSFHRAIAFLIGWLLIFSVSFEASAKTARSGAAFKIQEFSPEQRLSKTNINMGSIRFLKDGDDFVDSALGFKIGSKIYYLFDSTRPTIPLSAYINSYVIHKDLLIVNGYEGTSGCNNWLFLFKFQKHRIKLIGVLSQNYLHGQSYDFALFDNKDDAPKLFRDLDGNGKPEVKIDLLDRHFCLFIEASNGLKVNLNSKLYRPLYNKLKNANLKNERELQEFCVYHYLSMKPRKRTALRLYARKINQYYNNLIEVTKKFPDGEMTDRQVFDYLQSRKKRGYEFGAIEEALFHTNFSTADKQRIVEFIRETKRNNLKWTIEVINNFPNINKAFRPYGLVKLRRYKGRADGAVFR